MQTPTQGGCYKRLPDGTVVPAANPLPQDADTVSAAGEDSISTSAGADTVVVDDLDVIDDSFFDDLPEEE